MYQHFYHLSLSNILMSKMNRGEHALIQCMFERHFSAKPANISKLIHRHRPSSFLSYQAITKSSETPATLTQHSCLSFRWNSWNPPPSESWMDNAAETKWWTGLLKKQNKLLSRERDFFSFFLLVLVTFYFFTLAFSFFRFKFLPRSLIHLFLLICSLS